MRHFELEEIPIPVRHPESNSRLERSHCSVHEEALGDRGAGDLLLAGRFVRKRLKHYNP